MTIAASWLDYAIIAFYFLGILWVGTLFGKYTKSTKDFFFGGQRFAWWLVAISSIATVVGSYSFIKYAAIGYRHGFSSTVTYLNDWFIIPFFLLGWLPIIYFNRIQSIPEYFTKRFDRRTGMATVVIILVFLTGYVGINFYTLGVAMQPLIGVNLYLIVVVVAMVGARSAAMAFNRIAESGNDHASPFGAQPARGAPRDFCNRSGVHAAGGARDCKHRLAGAQHGEPGPD